MTKEKPYLHPPPGVLVDGKVVRITSLPEDEQNVYEDQIRLVSKVSGLDFCEDDEWMV